MKTSKVLGAVALTAALAMGTMPAFAAGATDNWAGVGGVGNDAQVNLTNTEDDVTGSNLNRTYKGTGDTVIKAQTYVVQLNVTIPIEMGVAIPATDGAIIFPSSSAYQIKNNSTEDVTILNANTQTSLKDKFVLKSADSDFGANGKLTAPTDEKINYYLTMTRAEDPGATAIKLQEGTNTTLNYKISKGESMGVEWNGECAFKGGANTDTKLNNQVFTLATVSYTVSATADLGTKPPVTPGV